MSDTALHEAVEPDAGSGDHPPLLALVAALQDLHGVSEALASAYQQKLSLAPPRGSRSNRWRMRTLSALRAVEKASLKTERSLQKIKRMEGA